MDLVGLHGGCVRLPMLEIAAEEREELRGILAEQGLLD